MAQAVGSTREAAPRFGLLVQACFGGTLVFYNITVIAYSLPFVGEALFQTHDRVQVALNTLAVVAGGYLAKPAFQLLSGLYADRHGRKPVLLAASLLAALTSLLLAVLPGVGTIGVAAPIAFTALVALQAGAAGAEWPLLAAYIAESWPRQRRGYFTAFASFNICLGWLLAILVPLILHAALSQGEYTDWGWRAAFAPAVILGLLSFVLRRRLPESPRFTDLVRSGGLSRSPLRDLFIHQARTWLAVLLLVGAVSAGFFLTVAYPVVFVALADKFSPTEALGVGAVGLAVLILGLWPAGALADRIGPRPVAATGFALLAVFAFPGYALMADGRLGLGFLGVGLLAAALALPAGVYEAWFTSSFASRYTGTAATCNGVAIAVFGSPTLLLAGYVAKDNGYLAVAVLPVLAGLLGTFVSLRLMSPSIHEPLA